MRKLSAALDVTVPFLLGQEIGKPSVELSVHRVIAPDPMYRVNEDAINDADEVTREKCKAHFDHFVSTCDTRAKLGWLWCELLEKFPLNKFKKEK